MVSPVKASCTGGFGMQNSESKSSKRLHFGVLMSTIDNACQQEAWNAIVEYAKDKDIHLTAYIGTYQNTDNTFNSYLDSCFESLCGDGAIDGLLFFSGFIAQNIGLDGFDKYIARIPKHLPTVSISFALPGVPSVLTDNTNGIYNAVEHLIKVHNRKMIAFVKGPEGHPEAEARFSGYKNALAANGIEFDERLVFPGDFGRHGGREAVSEMIDKRLVSVDAIAASNDQSAIGILTALRKRDILVPSSVAVTGFDDDIISAMFGPSISTIRQNFTEIGQVSIDTLYNVVKGKQVSEITYVNPVFVPRQSCGCLEEGSTFVDIINDDLPVDATTLLAFVSLKFTRLFEGYVPEQQVRQWVTSLVGMIVSDNFIKDDFLRTLDEILVNYNHYYEGFHKWHEALNILAMGVEVHNNEVKCAQAVLSALILATSLVHDIRYKEERRKEYFLGDDRLRLRRITNALLLMFDMDTLADELHRLFPSLSINTALVALYHNPIKCGEQDANRTIETLIGFDGDTKFNLKHNSWNPIHLGDYSTITDFDFERERRTILFLPLFFHDEEMGVFILPYDIDISVDTYDRLRVNISTATKGAELLSKVQTLSITDELTGLLNRRGFFQFVYAKLHHLVRNPDVLPIVMFMDMDGLKLINDNYGHMEGDIAISSFASVLKESTRDEDIVGRIGGDEFVVFSSVKSLENGRQIVDRIRLSLDEYNSKKLHPYQVAGSIGSVILETATKECFEAAMLSADNVLYEEKMEKKKKGLSRQ
jgi:diguanylate cyclase (GGDEF)-like protein